MRFISHLDLNRMLHRTARRAEVPVTMTKGFSPHMKISITRALKLGLESQAEEAIFYLDKDIGPEEFVVMMNEKLPSGVKIVTAEKKV